MSDLEARIAEVFSKHIPSVVYYSAEEGHVACHGCDWSEASFSGFYDHQSAMLASVIREAQAEAWDKGAFDASMSLDHGGHNANNPYREES